MYERLRAENPPVGFVYVMESAGYYKIGFSVAPRKRRSTVQGSCPTSVRLVGVIEGSPATEAEWHHALRHKRVHGEWFDLTEAEVAAVLHDCVAIDPLPGDDDIA